MANVIGETFVRVRGDTTGFQQSAEPGVKSSMIGLAKTAALAFGGVFAAQKLFDFGKSAIEEASLTQKATENIKAQFGGLSAGVLKFSDDAATAFGINKNASEQFASQIALTGKNIGLTRDQTAQMAVGFQKLAGSVGLIKGQDPNSYFHTLQLAMLGNTRGLKQMGIAFSSTQQSNEALRLGIKGTSSTWTEADKAQIIYGLTTQKLPALLAQAKQHSNDLADSQIRLSAEFSNVKEEIGAALLPVFADLFSFLAGSLPTAINVTKTALSLVGSALSAAFTTFAPVLGVVEAAFGRVVSFIRIAVGQFESFRAAGLSLSQSIQDTLVTVLVRLGVSWQTSEQIISTAAAVFGRVVGVIREVAGAVIPVVQSFISWATSGDTLRSALAGITAAITGSIGFISRYRELFLSLAIAVGAITTAIVVYTVATTAWEAITAAATVVQEAFNLAVEAFPAVAIITGIVLAVAALIYFYRNNEQVRAIVLEVWDAVKTAFRVAYDVISAVVRGVAAVIREAVSIAMTIWERFGGAILAVVRTYFDAAKAVIVGALKVIQGIIQVVLGVIHGNWSQVWNGLKLIVSGVLGAVVGIVQSFGGLLLSAARALGTAIFNGIKSGLGDIAGWVAGKIRAIPGALGNLGSLLYNAGVQIVSGLLRGLLDKFNSVKNTVSGWAGDIASLKGPLDYDRQLLVPHGLAISAGLNEGLTTGFAQTQQLAGRVAGQIAASVQAAARAQAAGLAAPGAALAPGGGAANGAALLSALATPSGHSGDGVHIDKIIVMHPDPHAVLRGVLNEVAARRRRR